MRKKLKRIVCLLFAVFVMAVSFPFEVFALDPVSSAAIANAFAQAITAYGASNGVSLTFDSLTSGNSSQIGEVVHGLWKNFREGQQTADDYETLAAAIFPGLYSKAITAGGTAVVALHIADTYMPDVDAFWNWLLSGPAEMVKVDNAYQWNYDQTTGNLIQPIIFNNYSLSTNGIGWDNMPVYQFNSKPNGNDLRAYGYLVKIPGSNKYVGTTSPSLYMYVCGYTLRYLSLDGGAVYDIGDSGNSVGTLNLNNGSGIYSNYKTASTSIGGTWPDPGTIPRFDTNENAISALNSWLGRDVNDPYPDTAVASVQPYVGDAVAKPVPIPDTSDPDYGPLPYIGNLPIPWNDTLFGDGTGTLTDEQSDAITDAIDDAIVANPDKTIEMENAATDDPDKPTTDDPPSNNPGDYAVPGLQNIFPFCIPFDVYNFLSALAAEPTAPHFTATLQFPAAIGGPQTIDIDFNNQTFNTLAGILRTLELLAFIVGLALLTRSMFIRG